MSISRVTAAGSPGVDLVALFNTHVGLHDQRDANRSVAGAALPAPANPLSAALAHPSRWPSFLKANLPARGKQPRKGESRLHLARSDRGDEAELPSWQRMEPGERSTGPIPGNNRMEVPVQADPVHGRRVGAESFGNDGAMARQAEQEASPVNRNSAPARRAILERERSFAWLARSFAPAVAAAA